MPEVVKEKKCSVCYYSNAHGKCGTCTNHDAMKYFNEDVISYDHGSKQEKGFASNCPFYQYHSHYDYNGCHGKYNPHTV